jgi:hypothetical protein
MGVAAGTKACGAAAGLRSAWRNGLGFRFAHHFIEEIVTAQFGHDPTDQGGNEFAEGQRDASREFCQTALSLVARRATETRPT